MRKFLFLILAAVSLSFAAYDLFPVPQNKGANFRLNTNLNFGSVDYSSETQYFTRLILDMRFYYNDVSLSNKSTYDEILDSIKYISFTCNK